MRTWWGDHCDEAESSGGNFANHDQKSLLSPAASQSGGIFTFPQRVGHISEKSKLMGRSE